jgi:hypothetical protein
VVKIGLGGVADCKLLPDDDVDPSHMRRGTELAIRKAAIPVDDNDAVADVYDSWYELLRALRQLARQVPVRVLHSTRLMRVR